MRLGKISAILLGIAAVRSITSWGLGGLKGRPLKSDSMLFHSEAIEQARQILVSFINKEGQLESVKFKYLLDTTRKFAIPLLDYFDRVGVTRREGYTRYLKSRG